MKTYTGTCYIGVASSTMAHMEAVLSILNIKRRGGDAPPNFIWGTKGYETRQMHVNKFIESEHDFILLLDNDMIFEPDTLERLRSHERPFISGFYMRRRRLPLVPVWFQPYTGEWPIYPFTDIPESGKLYELGASGWGCMLLHREVILETRKLLNGQWDIAEQPMDFWPGTNRPLLKNYPHPIGSDVRFPFYAKHAGYVLYGDPDVSPGHILDHPIYLSDYAQMPANVREEWATYLKGQVDILRSKRT